ncbi:MAG: beta-ketoacyl synthase N-terminal-like domain-containing protein, partial [Pseudomonadota bacterium]
MRRVVVTGLGMVTPLGGNVDATWKGILAGKSGANKVTNFKVDDLACQIAAQIPRDPGEEGAFNPDDWMDVKEQRKVDDFIVYAMAAADQAMADSGFKAETYEQQARSGVLIGSGIGGLQGIEQG